MPGNFEVKGCPFPQGECIRGCGQRNRQLGDAAVTILVWSLATGAISYFNFPSGYPCAMQERIEQGVEDARALIAQGLTGLTRS